MGVDVVRVRGLYYLSIPARDPWVVPNERYIPSDLWPWLVTTPQAEYLRASLGALLAVLGAWPRKEARSEVYKYFCIGTNFI